MADLEADVSPLLLSGLLTLLRVLTAGAAAVILGAEAAIGQRAWPWQDPVVGILLAVYVLGGALLFLLMALLPQRPAWLIDLSFILDFALLGTLSLVTAGSTALLILPVLFAV